MYYWIETSSLKCLTTAFFVIYHKPYTLEIIDTCKQSLNLHFHPFIVIFRPSSVLSENREMTKVFDLLYTYFFCLSEMGGFNLHCWEIS